LGNFRILDDITFWDKLIDIKNEFAQKIYIDIKSLIRFELVYELNKTLNEKFVLVGSNWKNKYPNALENNYSDKFIEEMYSGNICIDFGSKNSEKCIYPRSCKIIESGGLLFQSIHKDSKDIFKDLFNKTCFISLDDMKTKVDYFLNNPDTLESFFLRQQKNFETDDLNYKTLKKIESFLYK